MTFLFEQQGGNSENESTFQFCITKCFSVGTIGDGSGSKIFVPTGLNSLFGGMKMKCRYLEKLILMTVCKYMSCRLDLQSVSPKKEGRIYITGSSEYSILLILILHLGADSSYLPLHAEDNVCILLLG